MKKASAKPKAKARAPRTRTAGKRRGGAPKASEAPHPLSMEAQGFTLAEHWPGLFKLYVRGTEARAELCEELHEIERALVRNRSTEDRSAPRLEAAFFNVLVVQEFLRIGKWPEALNEIAGSVGFTLAETVGADLLRVWSAGTEASAEMAADDVLAAFKRTLAGMVRMKFPKAARGSGETFPKELLAIWEARGQCERLRRLPTRRELRARLEAIGLSYRNTKDEAGKWRTMFDRAGLDGLPD